MDSLIYKLVMEKYDQISISKEDFADVYFSSSEIIESGLQSIVFMHQGFCRKKIKSIIWHELNRQEMKTQNFLGSLNYSYDLNQLPNFGITFEVPQNIPILIGKEVFEQSSGSMVCFLGTVVNVEKMRLRLMQNEFECRSCGHTIDTGFLSDSASIGPPKVCDLHTGGCGRNTNQSDFVQTGKQEYEEFFRCKIKPEKSRRHLLLDVSDIDFKEIYSSDNRLKITAMIGDETKPTAHHVCAEVVT
jgi:DNA replicative helicase MCM subunit Mcm2 (Cdc46/Mcm family)